MRVTEGWIESVVYSRGTAITRAQLEILGLRWPPENGWKKKASGIELTDTQARMFEDISIKCSRKNKKRASCRKKESSPAVHSLTFDDLEPADMSLLGKTMTGNGR